MRLFSTLFLFFIFFIFSKNIFSQGMGISEISITPNTSSILELRSTTKGFLIPRLTAAQIAAMDPLPEAAQGLLVYQTDGTQGYYYNTSITTTPMWVLIAAGGQPWTDLGAIVHNTTLADQVSVGTSTPTAGVKFEVQSTGGIGIFGQESGSNTDNYGIYGFASGATNNNIGILAYGVGTSVLDADTTYGVLAIADVVASSNGIGVAGIISATDPDYAIGVQGYAEQKAASVSGNFYGGYFSPNALGTGATGFGIYADAAGFATNWAGYFGAGNVYIENNLGIGASSPAEKLDVQGRIFMLSGTAPVTTTDRLYNVSGNLFWNGTQVNSPGGTLPSGTSGQTLRHDGTSWVANSNLFNDGTNVGIGTTALPTLLIVQKTGANPSVPSASSTGIFRVAVASNEGIDFGKMAASPYSGWIQAGFGGTADPLTLQPSGGNVGIGLNSPVNKLDVEGAMAVGATYSGTSTAPTNGAIIQGNVGIGTSSPSTRLDVRTTTGGYGIQVINSETAISAIGGIYGLADGANAVGINKYGGLFQSANGAGTNYGVYGEALLGTGTNIGGYFSAGGAANNYAIVVPSTGGNVAIGTTSTSANAKLAINDGHLQAKQTTAPTIARGAQLDDGAGGTFSLANATDMAGKITFNPEATTSTTGAMVVITFNKSFAVAPVIVLTPANNVAAAGVSGHRAYVGTITTTGFTVFYDVDPDTAPAVSGVNNIFHYHVIETQ